MTTGIEHGETTGSSQITRMNQREEEGDDDYEERGNKDESTRRERKGKYWANERFTSVYRPPGTPTGTRGKACQRFDRYRRKYHRFRKHRRKLPQTNPSHSTK